MTLSPRNRAIFRQKFLKHIIEVIDFILYQSELKTTMIFELDDGIIFRALSLEPEEIYFCLRYLESKNALDFSINLSPIPAKSEVSMSYVPSIPLHEQGRRAKLRLDINFDLLERIRNLIQKRDKDLIQEIMNTSNSFVKKKGGRVAQVHYRGNSIFSYNGKEHILKRKESNFARACHFFYTKCPKLSDSLPWTEVYKAGVHGRDPYSKTDIEKLRGWLRRFNDWAKSDGLPAPIIRLKNGTVERLR